jgi:hypothetical protein
MAIRYVKDFEFPSAAGYTKSSPSQVTGQMFAKGGKVEAEKAPKGLMVIIGVGKPKGPMKKAEGGKAVKVPLPVEDEAPYPSQWPMPSDEQINKENWNQRKAIRRAMGAKNTGKDTFAKGGDVKSVPVKDIKSGKVKQSTDEDFYGKAKDMPMPTRRPSMMKKGGYAEGGMKAEQGVALPDMSPEKEMFEVYDRQTGDVVGTYGSLKRASRAVDRRDNEYGGYRYGHRPVAKAKGGMAHEDVAADKSLIKSMIKPAALKKAMGGQAVQMAKSNAVEASMKGQKKTPYADGGMALAAPQVASPLQQMARKSVPVAPRAPMIPQQAAPAAGAPRIGVGRSRSGKPDVGAIRAAMARAATQATPENAPGMMKKGGKVGC